jgi:hypothetical protein
MSTVICLKAFTRPSWKTFSVILRCRAVGQLLAGGWSAYIRWHVPRVKLPGLLSLARLSQPRPGLTMLTFFCSWRIHLMCDRFHQKRRWFSTIATAQNVLGASVFWIRRVAALGDEQAAISHWQIKRDGGRRGITEVINHD